MLKLSIDNIGIVKNSEIVLNGITAITGHNNSGKTTIGKALYSIVSSVEDLSNNIVRDKNNMTMDFVKSLTAEIQFRLYTKKDEADAVKRIKSVPYTILAMKGVDEYLDCVQEAFHDAFDGVLNKSRNVGRIEFYTELSHSVKNKIQGFREKIKQEFETIDYVNNKLDNILSMEFNHQVLPVNGGVEEAYIWLFEDEKKIFDAIIGKKGLRKRRETFSMSMFDKKCVFIDDVFVLDDLGAMIEEEERERKYLIHSFDRESLKSESHKQKLMNKLWQKDGNLYSDMLNKDAAEKIYDRLEGVFGDKVVLESGRLVCANSKIHIGNLAMGAKVFALLKMLLDNGTITKDTILILDEPEVHLHPAWQNVLAELLVLVMQEVGATILLTTHSSQFLMALETYVKQYQKQENFKVYTTERLEDGHFVQYVDQTENIKEVYYKLAKPLFDIKAIKDSIEG